MIKFISVFVLALLAISCNTPSQNNAAPETTNPDMVGMATKPTDSLTVYTAAMLDSKKDVVCGMPISAGVSDTAHYKGKAYGFCAKECKDEFLKSPEQYLSAK